MEVAEILGEVWHTVLLGKSQGVSRVVLFSGSTSLWIIFMLFFNCKVFIHLYFYFLAMPCWGGGILVSHPGFEPASGVWSLTTGPPGKSLHGLFLNDLNSPFCLFFIYTA